MTDVSEAAHQFTNNNRHAIPHILNNQHAIDDMAQYGIKDTSTVPALNDWSVTDCAAMTALQLTAA